MFIASPCGRQMCALQVKCVGAILAAALPAYGRHIEHALPKFNECATLDRYVLTCNPDFNHNVELDFFTM